MKILDSSEKSSVRNKKDINKEKNFITDNDEEFQYSLSQKGTIINDHIHPDQKEVYKTTEVLVVIEGEMIVKIMMIVNNS